MLGWKPRQNDANHLNFAGTLWGSKISIHVDLSTSVDSSFKCTRRPLDLYMTVGSTCSLINLTSKRSKRKKCIFPLL